MCPVRHDKEIAGKSIGLVQLYDLTEKRGRMISSLGQQQTTENNRLSQL